MLVKIPCEHMIHCPDGLACKTCTPIQKATTGMTWVCPICVHTLSSPEPGTGPGIWHSPGKYTLDYLKPVIITQLQDRDIQGIRLWGTIHKVRAPCQNTPICRTQSKK